MEQDIIQMADEFLDTIFQDKLNESDKLSLEHWLRTQLEKERDCWKEKIKLSFEEVEKERKLALAAHTTVHAISDQIEAVMDQYNVEIGDQYDAAEPDNKRNHITRIERNVRTILHSISSAIKDHRACLQYLGYDIESKVAVFPILVSSVDELKQRIQDTRTDFNIREEDLRRDMVRLHEELAETRTKYEALLQETERLQDQISPTASEPETDIKCPKCDMNITAVDNERREVNSSTTEQKGVQVCPVDIPELLSNTSTQVSDYKQTPTLEGILEMDHGIEVSKSLLKSPRYEQKSPCSSSGSSENGCPVIAPSSCTMTSVLRPQVRPLPLAPGLLGDPSSTAHPQSQDSSPWERHQLNSNIAKTHSHGEVRLASLRKACSEGSLHPAGPVKLARRGKCRTPHGTAEHEGYSDGYLSGVRQEIINTHASTSYEVQAIKHIHWRKTGDSKGVYNAGNRCLRCHKLYSLKDNHRMACRYHQKGKRKLEKYDARGRLLMVTYIWECCMQRPEALGCSTGEHV